MSTSSSASDGRAAGGSAGAAFGGSGAAEAAAGEVVVLEQAKSGRSTCRATGEPIEKGAWRVGFETFIGGRMAMAWMARQGGSGAGGCCPAWASLGGAAGRGQHT